MIYQARVTEQAVRNTLSDREKLEKIEAILVALSDMAKNADDDTFPVVCDAFDTFYQIKQELLNKVKGGA